MKLLLNWVLLCAHHLLINGLEPENQSAIPCGHLNFKEMGESNDQFIECNLSGNTISETFLSSESSESTDRFIHDAIDCMYNGNQYTEFGEDIKIRSKRQTQQTADTTTPIDAKLKRKLKLHFTEDFEPQYFAFYHWLYKSLDNGKIPVYRKIKESVMDVNFVPSPNGISSTPFPIPEKLEAVYEYILYEKNGLKPNVSFSYIRPSPDTDDFEYGSEELAMTQVPITPMRHEIRDKLQKHFTEATMKPEYETFYKWLYEKLDFGKIPLSNKYDQLVTDKNFRPKSRWPVTPFPVPFKYNAIFEYLWRQEYLKYKKDDSLDRRR